MNVRSGWGPIHHFTPETLGLLCGHSQPGIEWSMHAVGEPVSCPACVRLLADDVRRQGPRSHDSED